MRVAVALVVGTCCSVAACGEDGATLFVDLKTDLVPGDEFHRVRTEVRAMEGAPALAVTHDALATDPFLDGRRVAELDGLAPGTMQVIVELSKSNGNVVATRPVVVQMTGDTAITVVVTRDCVGVECPRPEDESTAIACLGGGCVEPTCSEAMPELCGPPNCSGPADCPPSPSCVEARCELGACLASPMNGRCAPGQTCDLVLGCLGSSDVDAGGPVSDGGTAPMDSGAPDAGSSTMDAGVDAGAPDGGGDSGPPPPVDAGPPGALACADVFLGSAIGSEVASGTTRSMGDDYGQCLGSGSPDVTFGWIAPAAGRYTFSTCGSSFDTVLTALDGSCTGPSLRCNDDRCGWESSISLDLAAAAEIVIIVDGLAESGSYVLNVEAM